MLTIIINGPFSCSLGGNSELGEGKEQKHFAAGSSSAWDLTRQSDHI